ncbi:BamA/TamA family outer membrane protein [Roseivivax sp. GX 12232]|uniref:autotransporter assembly complex protein TamA n=1 Tax=Roseivivax sp. GX 12232 TaxID=2900547 RepID=UPI001E49D8A8|nr:BamA/TamA family outer membrane protein [Roseivivax sp. GX 12232]
MQDWVKRAAVSGLGLMLWTLPAAALEEVEIRVEGPSEEVETRIETAISNLSRLTVAVSEGIEAPQDVAAAALADYSTAVQALYDAGYYSGTVGIALDGQEASELALLNLPQGFSRAVIRIDTGPQFRFREAEISPTNSRTELPEGFAPGQPAETGVIREAVSATIESWRQRGHAKARTESQRAVAFHDIARLDVAVGIDPGPRLNFGRMVVTTDSNVRQAAIRRIAGFPEGARFDPDDVERVVNRLRRTGAFSSVTMTEAETPGADGRLDMRLAVSDRKPRRIGFGAELSTQEGGALTAFWLHRNIFGGAERLRFDGDISNIGSAESGLDYSIAGRLDIPAVYGAETDGYIRASLSREDEPTYLSNRAEFGVGATRRLSDRLTSELGLGLRYSETEDDLGTREFLLLTLPGTLTYDTRSNELNPKSGYYVTASATPFLGLNSTDNGVKFDIDARGYWGFGEDDPNVAALRIQLGSVVGPELTDAPPDFLYTSGGGGTVRGQPFRSLTVDLGGGDEIGGRSFLGLSAEYRRDVTENLGLVGFYDTGYIGAESAYDGSGQWHAGAGIGVRYQTGIGPIRFDVAGPAGGETGDGVQFYIGIGQAF